MNEVRGGSVWRILYCFWPSFDSHSPARGSEQVRLARIPQMTPVIDTYSTTSNTYIYSFQG